jgi:indolepyruvate ferredoxin oxidoreductase, beta subunit
MNAPFETKTRPITIAIIDIAERGGYIAQLTSVPGVAQRTGATNYYLEIFRKPVNGGREPVMALLPMPGDIDVVIASELMEAGRAIQRGLVTPDRTTLIASTNRVFSMAERTAMTDGRVDEAALLEGCRGAAKTFYAFDMAALAEATGSVISAVLFGALAGSRALPFERAAYEGAIRRGGVGIQASLAAFTAGFEAAAAGAAPATSAPPASAQPPAEAAALAAIVREVERDVPKAARKTVRVGVERAADYQDIAYARLYLQRLKPIVALEAGRDDRCRLLQETARQLALGMTYEDTIRVAELKIRPSRFARVRAEVRAADGQIIEIAEFMHPRTQEIADTLPAPLGRFILQNTLVRGLLDRMTRKGKTVKTTSIRGFLLLYVVAALKPLRPRSLRYGEEQSALQQWLDTIAITAPKNYDLAVEVAAARNLVKGYGDTHERGRARFETLMKTLPSLVNGPDGAAKLAALRKAANADDTGAALAAAVASLAA